MVFSLIRQINSSIYFGISIAFFASFSQCTRPIFARAGFLCFLLPLLNPMLLSSNNKFEAHMVKSVVQ